MLIRDGRSLYADGSRAVVFRIAAGCDEVATQVSEHFGQTEWRPRSTQYLNPQLATSFIGGCQSTGGGVLQLDSNGRPIPPKPYNEWRGEWENGRGDVVSYVVGGTGQQLRGYAVFIPRHVVEHSRGLRRKEVR